MTEVPPSARLVVAADWTPAMPPTDRSVADTDSTSGELYWTVKLWTPGVGAVVALLSVSDGSVYSPLVASSGRSTFSTGFSSTR